MSRDYTDSAFDIRISPATPACSVYPPWLAKTFGVASEGGSFQSIRAIVVFCFPRISVHLLSLPAVAGKTFGVRG